MRREVGFCEELEELCGWDIVRAERFGVEVGEDGGDLAGCWWFCWSFGLFCLVG